MSARRFTLGILTGFGGVALFLAGLGIYGVLANSVAEQRPEIGIRLALGASTGEVVRSVIGRTLTLAAIGIGVGGALSLLSARLLESLLYQVNPVDPVTFGAMAGILMTVAAVAGLVPAVRAAGVRGVSALRGE